jgi:SPX domain protein involved in polyphosphate accumulation
MDRIKRHNSRAHIRNQSFPGLNDVLTDMIEAGKDLKTLAKFLEVNITGTRKILKQLEKKT